MISILQNTFQEEDKSQKVQKSDNAEEYRYCPPVILPSNSTSNTIRPDSGNGRPGKEAKDWSQGKSVPSFCMKYHVCQRINGCHSSNQEERRPILPGENNPRSRHKQKNEIRTNGSGLKRNIRIRIRARKN